MLNERKSWTSQEDQLLIKIYEENKQKIQNQTLHWNFVAQKLNQCQSVSKRSGKQCRERWFNQLNPEIIKNNIWNLQDKQKLIQLHDLFGNRWAFIAKYFPGRTDNCIKNYMNSTLRKALRYLNLFVSRNRKFNQFKFKNGKEYKGDLVNKILFFSGSKNPITQFQQDFLLSTFSSLNKQQILAEVYRLAADIKGRLMWIQSEIKGNDEDLGVRSSYKPMPYFQELIDRIQELNGLCKKRKQKRSRSQSFRWKKSNGKGSDIELATFNFHSGALGICYNQIPYQSKLVDNIEGDKRYSSNQAEAGKNVQNLEKQQQIGSSCPNERQCKLNEQQSQNNGSYKQVEINHQYEVANSVNLKLQEMTELNKELKITSNPKLKNKIAQSPMRFIKPTTSYPHQPQKPQSSKNQAIQTRLSLSSLFQKSRKPKSSDTLNLQYQSESEMQDQYPYFMLSDCNEDQKYLPLYPSYGNPKCRVSNRATADYAQMDDGEGSDEDVV